MAITKNHTINTTLKTAIDYITSKEKTDGNILIYSFACTPKTADIEFDVTRRLAGGKGKHLARHIIQAFEPGETTPEQAHEIGRKWADEILGGKYEYILATHIDKNHIHNHIICNDVSFVDYKHIHINKQWYNYAKRTGDRLCREYGLSTIEAGKDKGKSYKEYTAEKNGTSWKAKLKRTIDTVIPRARDFDDFLRLMEQSGYEIKKGKYISFRAAGQERYTRAKTLGGNYTAEAITDRILNKSKIKKPSLNNGKQINLLIDIQNSIKAQESKGYEYWAKKYNLQNAAKTMSFLNTHGIGTYSELQSKIEELNSGFDKTADELKSVEKQIKDIHILRKDIMTYREMKPVYSAYKKAKNKAAFYEKHRREIMLYESAAEQLTASLTDGKLPTVDSLNKRLERLTEQKNHLYSEYKKARKAVQEYDTIKRNVDMIINKPKKQRKPPDIEL